VTSHPAKPEDMPMRRRVIVLIVALAPAFLAASAAAQHLRIYFPDIEQGNAVIVVSPTGRALVYDGGTERGATDDKAVLVVRDLIDAGVVTSLDYVVASHYDEDHIAGLDDVLNYGGVSSTIVTYDRGDFGGTPSTFAFFDYLDAAQRHNRTTIAPGTVIDLGGGVTLECVVVNGQLSGGGSVDISGSSQFENSATVGLVLRYGDFDAWLSGDLTGNPDTGVSDVESAVAPLVGDLDLYNLNHHGSRTSSNATFLAAMKAEVGFNQSSAGNSFGHPNSEVVQRFLDTLDTSGGTPLFFQQNPGNPTDTRSDDSLASAIADPDDVDGPVGLPGSVVLFSDGTSYRLWGGGVGPFTFAADSGPGTPGDYPPAILQVSRTPVVPLASESVTVDARVADEGAFTAQLRWWLDDVEQTPVAMSLVSGDTYRATLPSLADGSKVAYRVEATDGLSQSSLSAAEGYYSGVTPIATFRVNEPDGVLVPARYDVRVEGDLTAEPGLFHSFVSQIYVQDATGGVQVFDGEILPLARGDRVRFVGELEQFSGQTEVNIVEAFGNFGHTFVSSGTPPAPTAVTIAQILTDPEAWEGLLVRIDDASVVSGTIPESGNGNLTITDDGGVSTITLRIDGDTDVPGAATPTQPFDLVGLATQFDGRHPFTEGYQILPRERADILSEEVNLPSLLINEIHADPHGTLGDANGDGVRSATEDELVELINTGYALLDVSGWTISDEIGVRHVFPADTWVPAREAVVVFGGGVPTGDFGNATANGMVFTASTGTLALNNAGDTVTVADGSGAVVQSVAYGSEGGNDTSLNRDPDLTNTPFVLHSQAPASGGALFSPGTLMSGAAFTVPQGAVILTEVLYDPTGSDDGLEWIELFNTTDSPIDLSQLSIGGGGADYTNSLAQLEGTIQPQSTFVVGGPTSAAENANPVYDQVYDFSPDLQNAGTDADGVALFNVRAAVVTPTTVPIDAVVYGPANTNGLIDETGTANPPEVGDAPAGSSIERIDLEGAWQIQGAPTPNTWSEGSPPPPAPEGLLLSEVFYDAGGADDGLEWVELYNSGTETIDLSAFSLGNGGADYTSSLVQLSGSVEQGAVFVVGGPTSSSLNHAPVFDQAVDFSPDFQNSGTIGDGVALFAVPAAQVTASTVPVDAVVYGPNNSSGLIDETGSANPPEVGDAPEGSSIERVDLEGSWQIQGSPTPNASPLAGGGGGGDPTSMHVGSIVAGIENQGGGNKLAVVTVTIVDDSGAPVEGATVTGTFSGNFTGTSAQVTGGDGVATFTSGPKKGPSSYTFCVDDATHASLTYDPGSNLETCDGA
jgi:beta-lactamase superfamily II metal-dependent hydrolase